MSIFAQHKAENTTSSGMDPQLCVVVVAEWKLEMEKRKSGAKQSRPSHATRKSEFVSGFCLNFVYFFLAATPSICAIQLIGNWNAIAVTGVGIDKLSQKPKLLRNVFICCKIFYTV